MEGLPGWPARSVTAAVWKAEAEAETGHQHLHEARLSSLLRAVAQRRARIDSSKRSHDASSRKALTTAITREKRHDKKTWEELKTGNRKVK